MKNGTVVKEYEVNNSYMDELIYILNDAAKVCRSKYFHSIEYRCVFDINFTDMEGNDEVILSITLEYTKYRSQFSGLFKKNKNARNKGFRFNQIVKLAIKTHSSLSNISICHYLKLPIP